MSERRRHKRTRTNTRALIKSRWHVVDASCLDASPGGLMIRAGQEFALGEEVEVALEMSDGSRLICNGRVVRRDPRLTENWQGKGYGVQITEIETEAEQKLRKWLGSSKLGTGPVTRAEVLQAMDRASAATKSKAAAPPKAEPSSAGTPEARRTGARKRPGKRMDPLELQRVLLRLKKKRPKR